MKLASFSAAAALLFLSVASLVAQQPAKPPVRGAAPAEPAVPVPLQVYRGEGWSLAAPAAWKSDPDVRPPTIVGLEGQGTPGFPAVDGTLHPLLIGLKVQRLAPEVGRIDIVADAWKKHMVMEAGISVVGEIKQREGMVGGVPALILDTIARETEEPQRAEMHYTIIAAGPTKHVMVIDAVLSFHRSSYTYLQHIGLQRLLHACAESLTFGEPLVSPAVLEKPVAAYQWKASLAIARAQEGATLLHNRQYPRAATVLNDSLELSPELPAAHQQLAWLQVSAGDPRLVRPAAALPHAQKAVQITGMLDIESLDALALCYIKTGKPAEAADVFRKALEKDPGNTTLLERLSLYGR